MKKMIHPIDTSWIHDESTACSIFNCYPAVDGGLPRAGKNGHPMPKNEGGPMQAQYTLRGNTAHFQYGVAGNYSKYDVPATPDLVAYYNQQREEGETVNSLAGGDTQYAVVNAISSKVSAFEFVMTKHVRVDV